MFLIKILKLKHHFEWVILSVLFSTCTYFSKGFCDSDYSVNLIPKETLNVPQRIFKEYKKIEDTWGDPYNYLIYYFLKAGASFDNEEKDAMYIPLEVKRLNSKIVLVDVRNIQFVDDEEAPHFIVLRKTKGGPVSSFKWTDRNKNLVFISGENDENNL